MFVIKDNRREVNIIITSDFHVHSSFSGDCHIEMKLFIEKAIQIGIQNICFTEHHDIDIYTSSISWLLDFSSYQDTFLRMKEQYGDKINLLFGVELGIQPHLYKKLREITQSYPFDFILCSNHVANGKDPYLPEFYEGKSKEEAYLEYFNDILNNVKNYKDYDVYGHLDYVIRYGPYEDKHYLYEIFQDVFDEILKTIINNGRGIELNTSGFKYNLNDSHPSKQVIKRYKELGGEIITVGSDSHKPEQLLGYFDLAAEILLQSGFKYYTIFRNRQPEFIKLQ